MLKLFGASPGVGILIGIALLGFGLLTGRAVLAVAGGLVLVASVVRLMPGSDERGDGRPLAGRRR